MKKFRKVCAMLPKLALGHVASAQAEPRRTTKAVHVGGPRPLAAGRADHPRAPSRPPI